MSGDIIKEYLVRLGFKIDDAQYSKFVKGVETASIKVAALGAAAIAAAGVIIHEVDKIADKFNELNNLSLRLKISPEDIEEWKYAAELTGSTSEAMISSLEGLQRASGAAAAGFKRTKKIFDQIGVSIWADKAHKQVKDVKTLMQDLADSTKFRSLSTGQQLFSLKRLGIDPTLLRTILSDTKELREEQAQLMRSVGLDENKAAKEAADWHSSMLRIKAVLQAIWDSVAVKVMEKLGVDSKKFKDAILDAAPKIVEAITPIVIGIVEIAEGFGKVFIIVMKVASPILGWLHDLDDATGGWSSTILAAALAIQYLIGIVTLATFVSKAWAAAMVILRTAILIVNLALYANPLVWIIGIIILVIAVIAALVYAIYHWRHELVAAFKIAGDTISKWYHDVINWFGDLEKKLVAFWDKVKHIFGATSGDKKLTIVTTNLNNGQPLGASGGMAGKAVTLNQETNIHVTGASDPSGTANSIGQIQTRQNADNVRNMGGVLG